MLSQQNLRATAVPLGRRKLSVWSSMERRVGGNHSHEDGSEPKTPKDLPGQGEDENKQRKDLQGQSVKDVFFHCFIGKI